MSVTRLLATRETWLARRLELLDALRRPVESGAPLPEALELAADEVETRAVRSALRSLARSLRSGTTLSDALAAESPLCDGPLVAAARAGERSGDMASALDAAARLVDAELAFARSTSDALLEPALSVGAAVATIVVLLLSGAVSRMADLAGGPHGLGRLGASLTSHPVAWSCVAACTVVLAPLLPRLFGPGALDRAPVLGPLRTEGRLAFASRATAILVRSGVPADQALATAAGGLGAATPERRALLGLVDRVRAGESVARAAEAEPALPPVLRAVLESSRPEALASGLERAARFHDAEQRRLAALATALAAALAIVAAGVACGLVVVAAWSGYFTATGAFAH